jgi:hypothetical protein
VSIVKGADHFVTLSKEHVKNAYQLDTGGQYHKNSALELALIRVEISASE